jgi:hypothetical protein
MVVVAGSYNEPNQKLNASSEKTDRILRSNS